MILYQDDICLYMGTLNPVVHTHHAVEISIGVEATLVLNVNNNKPIQAKACMILPDQKHCILMSETPGEKITILIDADLPLARAIQRAYHKNISGYVLLDVSKVHKEIKQLGIFRKEKRAECMALTKQIIHKLFPLNSLPPVSEIDLRVRQVMEYIRKQIDKQDFDFSEIAEQSNLSESRLAHLFKQEVGIPFRKYVLWTRLKIAVDHILKGEAITKASYIAGFADASHFNKVYVQMFGLKPSAPLWS